jgi:hypothetical protein
MMKISKMIEELQRLQKRHGDLEVTVTAAMKPDENDKVFPDVFESTAETLKVVSSNGFGPHVRIFWQC